MAIRHTRKPLRTGRRLALLAPFAAVRGLLSGYRAGAQTAGHAICVRDGGPGLGDAGGLSGRFSSELFARLLLELPEHRRDLQSAYQDGNGEQLERAAHKLLGAVVYCDLPELAAALRELKQTTGSRDSGQEGSAFGKVIRLIDELLDCSGYSSGG
jgi:HPt (histidine-containing phosphotransfer) domain-containing protein